MVEHIKALMDRGVTFHRIEARETGKIRRRVAGQQIGSTDEISDRRVMITDAEIEKLVPEPWDLRQNFGLEPPPPSDNPQRRRKGHRVRS